MKKTSRAESEYISRLPEPDQAVIEEYRQLVGLAQRVWQALYQRVVFREWEQPDYDGRTGVGSCEFDALTFYDAADITEFPPMSILRLLRNSERGGSRLPNSCTYHREGVGCIQDEFKPPVCIAYYSGLSQDEMIDRFGRDFLRRFTGVMWDLQTWLHQLTSGTRLESRNGSIISAAEIKASLRELEQVINRHPKVAR